MLQNITIPTYNRAHCLAKAIRASLDQSEDGVTVTVVDDGSQDGTAKVVEPFLADPRFCFIRLAHNIGTAQAKNLSLMLSRYDAITFNDSDDIPHRDKALLQGRALGLRGHADDILDWAPLGHTPGSELEVEVALGAHRFVKLDGTVHVIDKRISLVDDFFPNLQSPSKTEGDWVLINSGLFRRSVFERLGGYLDSVEEDRELRNRLVAAGVVFHFVTEPLLTKIEMASSLTTDEETGYRGMRRRANRDEVWRRNRLYRAGVWGSEVERQARVEIDLSGVEISSISNPSLLTLNRRIPATEATFAGLGRALSAAARPRRTRAAPVAPLEMEAVRLSAAP